MHVLIVEDSPVVLKILKHLTTSLVGFELHFASTMKEAMVLLNTHDHWLVALIDLNLPDAPNGELVDLTLELGLPTIVLTGSYDDDRRELLVQKGVVDYVIKESRYSYQYAVNLIGRLAKNLHIKALVVDDSQTALSYIGELLKRHLFKVVTATNGREALKRLTEHPDVQLLITDNNMPIMDGFELVQTLRHKLNNLNIAIIGLSSDDDKRLSARFIKNGANDFLAKSFSHEEFYCRVMQVVNAREQLDIMRRAAYHDELTGLSNRRQLAEEGNLLFNQCREQGRSLAVAVLDVDHFKLVNDQFGHSSGDQVLQHLAHLMQLHFDGVGHCYRSGGEEFTILIPDNNLEAAEARLNALRQEVESEPVLLETGDVAYTISCGLTTLLSDTLEHTLTRADEHLYRAKEAGRNLVISDD